MAVARALLAILEEAFATAERVHKRRYVSDGGVLFDFEPQLAVEWERAEPALSADGGETASSMSGGFPALRHVFSIHSTRPSPWHDEVGTAPQPAKIEASAEVMHADAKLILDTLCARMADNTLMGVCGRMDFIVQNAVGPDGGMVGSVTMISVAA